MIVDKIENAGLYIASPGRIARAFELLKDNQLAQKADGRYEVDGDRLFYVLQSYSSKAPEECRFEAHQKYLDIQLMLSGSEVMGYVPVSTLTISTAYSDSRDIAFYSTPDSYSRLEVSEGMFALFYPEDAHMPGCQLGVPAKVRKVVVKARLDG